MLFRSPHLVAYQIYNCSLKEVRYKNFEHLKDIQAVYLGYNQLSSIPVDTFKDLTRLKFLSLQGNHLQTLNGYLFQNLLKIQELLLNHNRLHSLPKNIFENLIELKNISISNNQIESLTSDHFRNNKKIEKIFLDSNKIRNLSDSMFSHMTFVKVISLKENLCVNETFLIDYEECQTRFSRIIQKIQNDC